MGMAMTSTEPGYQAYVLRLWQAQSDSGLVWRASLHNPYTNERRAFASLGQLCAFLEEETARPTDAGESVLDPGEPA